MTSLRLLLTATILLGSACFYRLDSAFVGLNAGDVRARTRLDEGQGLAPREGVLAALRGSSLARRSGADGVVTLRNLPVASHMVQFSLDLNADGEPDFGRQVPITMVQRNGARVSLDLGNVDLGRVAQLTGSVRTAVGGTCSPGLLPPNGTVVVLDLEERATQVDDEGNFRLTGVLPGVHRAVAAAPGFLSSAVSVVLEDGKEQQLSQPLCLVPVGTSAGAVHALLVTPPGQPQPGLPNTLSAALTPLLTGAPLQVMSSAGDVSISAVPPSIYAFSVDTPEPFLPVRMAWLLVPEEGRDLGEIVVWRDSDGFLERASSASSAPNTSSSSSTSSLSSSSSSGSLGSSSTGGQSSSAESVRGRVMVADTLPLGGGIHAPSSEERVARAWTFTETSNTESVRIQGFGVYVPEGFSGRWTIWDDQGMPGVLDGPDVQLANPTVQAGQVILALNDVIPAGSTRRFLVTLTLSSVTVEGVCSPGATSMFSQMVGVTTGMPPLVDNRLGSNGTLRCVPRLVRVTQLPLPGTIRADYPVNTPAPLLRFRLELVGDNPLPMTLNPLRLNIVRNQGFPAGSVQLWRDNNGDGRGTPADVPLGQPVVFTSESVLDLGGVTVSSPVELVVMGELSGAASSSIHTVRLAALTSPDGPVLSSELFGASMSTFPNPLQTEMTVADVNADILDAVMADFDSDARVDLLYLDSAGGVFMLQGDPTAPAFRSTPQPILTSVTVPRLLRVADLNRDGLEDILLTTDDGLEVFFGNTLGSVEVAPVWRGVVPAPTSVVLGDVVKNGFEDVILTLENGLVVVFANTAAGLGPSTEPGFTVTAVPSARAVVVADFDHNGQLDLAVRGFQQVALALNSGTGLMVDTPALFTGTSPRAGLVAQDMNHDGRTDLVVPLGNGALINVLLNTSAPAVMEHVPTTRTMTSSSDVTTMAPFDWDGDGVVDVVSVGLQGVTQYLEVHAAALAAPYLTSRYAVSTGAQQLIAALPADMDVDGDVDLVLVRDQGAGQASVSILYGDSIRVGGERDASGAGTLTPDTSHTMAANPLALAAADFNQDGRLDVVTSEAGQSVRVWLNTGLETAPSWMQTSQVTLQGEVRHVAAADLDGDGNPDVMALMDGVMGARLEVRRGQAAGTLELAAWDALDLGTGLIAGVAVGDVVRDGRPDAVVLLDSPPRMILLINSAGHLAAGPTTTLLSAPYAVTLADIRSPSQGPMDGILDAVILGGSGALVSIHAFDAVGAAHGGWGVNADLGTGDALVAADFTRDGVMDLVVMGLDGSVVSLVGERSGTTLFRHTGTTSCPGFSTSARLAAGDMDRDGDLDVVAAGQGSAGLCILNNNTPSLLGLGPASAMDGTLHQESGPSLAGVVVGDFTRDGDLDVMAARLAQVPAVQGLSLYVGQ